MGLCKCSKRQVTNLFCFEHRVNVCESCLVTNHESCVVQTYLSWLTDSDYDSNCILCSEALVTKETVRLKCFHVLHWSCLNERVSQLPNTTAPAGYKCPICLDVIFPAINQVSPVIDQLREKLSKVEWAVAGLNFNNFDQNATKNYEKTYDTSNFENSTDYKNNGIAPISNQNLYSAVNIDPSTNNPFEKNTFIARSKFMGNDFHIYKKTDNKSSKNDNSSDAKYVKKINFFRLRNWRLPRSITRILIIIIVIIVFFYIISILSLSNKFDNIQEESDYDPHESPMEHLE